MKYLVRVAAAVLVAAVALTAVRPAKAVVLFPRLALVRPQAVVVRRPVVVERQAVVLQPQRFVQRIVVPQVVVPHAPQTFVLPQVQSGCGALLVH